MIGNLYEPSEPLDKNFLILQLVHVIRKSLSQLQRTDNLFFGQTLYTRLPYLNKNIFPKVHQTFEKFCNTNKTENLI